MTEEQDKNGERALRPGQKVSREEQGDLLADAVTGFFPPGLENRTPEGGAGGSSDEESQAGPAEDAGGASPGAADRDERKGPPEDGKHPDRGDEPASGGDVIPDSLWEQKMAWAKARAREGRLEEAEELYRELVAEDPSSVRALNNLGVLLDEMGDPEGAVAQLRIARKIEPQNREVMGNLGAALGALGRYAEAEEELLTAFRADPSDLQIRGNLGILLFRRGLYEQAVTELAAVCAEKPEDGLPFFYIGEALNRLGRVDEAIEALERVTELIPGNPKAYYTLGVLFDKKNVPEKASVMYRKARELTGS
jgi:tetratricopeptide (TPR) repeat protein